MKVGICTECGEWTEVESSCCGSGVWFEGAVVFGGEDEDE